MDKLPLVLGVSGVRVNFRRVISDIFNQTLMNVAFVKSVSLSKNCEPTKQRTVWDDRLHTRQMAESGYLSSQASTTSFAPTALPAGARRVAPGLDDVEENCRSATSAPVGKRRPVQYHIDMSVKPNTNIVDV